jgi:RNA polymerase sigma-70 factor (ECF subfamily)
MGILTAVPPWHRQYETLYREHWARVVRLCRLLLGDAQEAQEVAQEVFLRLMRRCQGTDAVTEWGPWLTRVSLNACRDRRRSGWWRRWRAGPSAIDETDLVDGEPTPERAALQGEERERIWRAFHRLPARQREVFVLRHLVGWSTEAAAEALALSPGSVKRHLFRAVRRLRGALGGDS